MEARNSLQMVVCDLRGGEWGGGIKGHDVRISYQDSGSDVYELCVCVLERWCGGGGLPLKSNWWMFFKDSWIK